MSTPGMIDKKTQLDLSTIEVAELDLTTMCNARCPLCFRQSKSFPARFQNLKFCRPASEIVSQLEKDLPALKTIFLIGQMSEPTTHPEFLDIVKCLKETMHLKVKICTNGGLHDEQYWSDIGLLLDQSNDEVWFSICGSTEEMHSRYRVGTSLQTILKNAAALREVSKVDCAKFIVFKYNYDDITSSKFKAQIASQFTKVEWLDTNIELDAESKYAEIDEGLLPRSEVLASHKRAMAIADFCQTRGSMVDISCQSLFDKQIQIDPFGNIFPCYTYFESNPLETWNRDYSDILAGRCKCCKLCNSKIASIATQKLHTP